MTKFPSADLTVNPSLPAVADVACFAFSAACSRSISLLRSRILSLCSRLLISSSTVVPSALTLWFGSAGAVS